MKLSEIKDNEQFDTDKISECIQELEQVLSKQDMNVGELLITYGNLGYKLGANLHRATDDPDFISEPPDNEVLKKLYYTNPTVGVAMMISGLTVTSWVENLQEDKGE